MEENKKDEPQPESMTFRQTCHYYNNEVGSQILKPTHDLLCHLPNQMTDFKRKYILETATVNVRLITLAFSTLAISMVSLKVHGRAVSALRNTVVGYFGLGTFLAPEIFNPFLQYGGNKK